MFLAASDRASSSPAQPVHEPDPEFLLARDLALAYERGRAPAVDRVSFQIGRGEFVAITGPSGCGKSSLLNLMGLLESPTSGHLVLGGQPYATVRDPARFRRENFGFVFQSFHLVPTLSALQNVLVPVLGAGGRVDAQASRRGRDLLAQVGMSAHADDRPPQLSGGERQRVAIARALVHGPRFVLADEPTGSLDSATAQRVLGLLESARALHGVTLVVVTHDPQVAARADRVLRMRDGRIEGAQE